MLKRKSRLVWKVLSFIICLISTFACAIFLIYNINQQNKIIKEKEIAFRSAFNNSNGNQWNLNSVNYIYENINYYDQYRLSNFNNFLDTIVIDNNQYIDNIYSASELGELNFLETYTNMDSIKYINTTNFIDELVKNYRYRYNYSNQKISAWSDTNISTVDYYGLRNDSTNNSDDFLADVFNANQIPNFNLKKVSDLSEYDQARYNLLDIPPVLTDTLLPYQNDFYSISKSNYQQVLDDQLWTTETREQLVVTWTNQLNKVYIDTSTTDFWINFLMRDEFKNISRLVVEPANLIIYRNNNNVSLKEISLNSISSNVLYDPSQNQDTITLSNWLDSCINSNPHSNFDFRSLYNKSDIESLLEMNIPLIVNVNDEQYRKNKQINEPTNIIKNMLYAKKPNGISDRNWGNVAYKNLRKLFVSTNNSYFNNSESFNLKESNNILVANTYTNAETNTSNSNASDNEFFSNQFYVCPNLQIYQTNSIKDFFNNYIYISRLPLYKVYNQNDFSDASYSIYKNINLQFLPETNNYSSSYTNYNLKSFINENQYLNDSEINTNINNYLNYLSEKRDEGIGKTSYFYFETYQNQWYADIPRNLDSSNNNYLFRYDYLYGISELLQNIVYPMSMFDNIIGYKNPYFLENDLYTSSNGTYITRYADPTTATIVYSQNFITSDKKEQPYPQFYLTNEEFENFILKKAELNNTNVIDFTFDDWIKYGWTSIDNDLDMISILKKHDIKLNSLLIPRIVQLNNNTTMKVKGFNIDKNLIISICLIMLISIFVLIEIFIFIMIIKAPSKYNWAYLKAEEEFGF